MFAYYNDGLFFRAVDPDYQPVAGEVLFETYATPEQLTLAFRGYAGAIAAYDREPLIRNAELALEASDVTVIRCVSAGVTIPAEWQSYRNALRAIVNGADTVSIQLPPNPPYPSGT